jgi:hypothetical protein
LAILLNRLVPLLFEDRPPLVMDLVHRSKPLSGRLDLRGATYPHVHRQTKNSVGRELVQVDVEVPKDVDDGGVEEKLKPRVQQIAEDDDLVITWPRYSFPARGSAGPDHVVLHERAHVSAVNLASAEGVRLRDLLSDSIASSFWGHGCGLNAK